jgi:raffinose/stachyose/melibiose transport system permease protein
MESKRNVYITHTLLILASIIAVYPLISIVLLAVNPSAAPPQGFYIPSQISFVHFVDAWTRGGFAQALLSSVIVTGSVVVLSVVLSTMAGYALGVLKFPLQAAILGLFVLGLVVPYEATVVPIYQTMKQTGLLGTYWSVILPCTAFSVALGTVWMRGYFANLPKSVSEAGAIDGANKMQILVRILAPMASPAIGTLATLLFLYTWNEFLLSLVMLASTPAAHTTPLALSFFAGSSYNTSPGDIAAAALMVATPVLIAYIFAQRRFVSGLLGGAVKE